MEKVLGIGGFFFRAKDPDALARWYADHLGARCAMPPESYDHRSWEVAQLTAAGIAVEVDPEHYPNGRFARLADPEGNPVQLWHAEGADRD